MASHAKPPLEILDRRRASDADLAAIAQLLATVWPRRPVEERLAAMQSEWRDYRGPEAQHPRSIVVREGGRVIAHAEAAPRTITTEAGSMTILALARVCTDPAERGRNLGAMVARACFGLVDAGAFPFALFQTSPPVRRFYERLGCTVVDNPIVNSLAAEPKKNPFWDEVAMRYPSGPGWPAGEIDLMGPGF